MWAGCVCVDDAARKWHIESQFPLMPWSSQARGFFSGAFKQENRENRDMVRVYYNDDNFKRLERAKGIKREIRLLPDSGVPRILPKSLFPSFAGCRTANFSRVGFLARIVVP